MGQGGLEVFAKDVIESLVFPGGIIKSLISYKGNIESLVFPKGIIECLIFAKDVIVSLVFSQGIHEGIRGTMCPRSIRTCSVAFESKGILKSFDINIVEGLVISRLIIKTLGISVGAVKFVVITIVWL